MLRKLVRRVILWAYPELSGFARGGVLPPHKQRRDCGPFILSQGVVQVSPETLKAYGHMLNRMNRIS